MHVNNLGKFLILLVPPVERLIEILVKLLGALHNTEEFEIFVALDYPAWNHRLIG